MEYLDAAEIIREIVGTVTGADELTMKELVDISKFGWQCKIAHHAKRESTDLTVYHLPNANLESRRRHAIPPVLYRLNHVKSPIPIANF